MLRAVVVMLEVAAALQVMSNAVGYANRQQLHTWTDSNSGSTFIENDHDDFELTAVIRTDGERLLRRCCDGD